MRMPVQKPGASVQDVATPREFLDACETRFGRFTFDLAATSKNAVTPKYFDRATDSLAQDWTLLRGNLWLNPEYRDITPWVRKAAEEASPVSPVFVLTPSAVDTDWWWDWIAPHSISYSLKPRLQFVGHTAPFPKGLALSVFGLGACAFSRWAWKAPRRPRAASSR